MVAEVGTLKGTTKGKKKILKKTPLKAKKRKEKKETYESGRSDTSMGEDACVNMVEDKEYSTENSEEDPEPPKRIKSKEQKKATPKINSIKEKRFKGKRKKKKELIKAKGKERVKQTKGKWKCKKRKLKKTLKVLEEW